MFMSNLKMVVESTPINVSHDTYRRECRYTKGLHIPLQDFQSILEHMCPEIKLYFDFHNPGKQIKQGTYLNGHSGLAKSIKNYYEQLKNDLDRFYNGQDFYVKII